MRDSHPLHQPGFFWRKLRAWFFNTAAALIILMAVLVGVGRLLAPHADALRPHLETQLSQALGGPVRIDRLEVSWPGLMPSMSLTGLVIEREDTAQLRLAEAVVELDALNAFKGDEVVTQLVLVAPELVVAQRDERWQLLWSGDNSPPPTSPQAEGDEPPSMALLDRWPDWLGFSMRSAQLSLLPRDRDAVALHVAEADFTKTGQRYRLTGWLAATEDGRERVRFRVALGQSDGRWSNAVAWLKADEVSLSYWLSEIGQTNALPVPTTVSAQAWLSWNEDDGARLDADIDSTAPHGVVQSKWTARRWPDQQDRAWAVELSALDFNGQRALQSLAVGVTPQARALALDWADLGAVHQALEPWMASVAAWPDAMSGRIDGLVLGLDNAHHAHKAQGAIRDVALAYDGPGRFIEQLTGELALAGDQVAVNLDGPLSVTWPGAVRGEIDLSSITGQVLISPNRLDLNQVNVTSEHFDAFVDGSIYRQPSRPFVDLWVRASRIESLDVRPLLPHRVIPAPALNWLDEALLNIGQARGHALLHFPVGLKTDRFTPGHLGAQVSFSDVDMAYARNWPVATNLTGEVAFSGQSLSGEVNRGEVDGLVLAAPRVDIEQLSAAVVELDLQGAGVLADGLASSLGRLPFAGWSDVFDPMDWSGELAADVSIRLPVNARDDWVINGAVEFDDNAVAFNQAGVALDGLNGAIEFDRQVIRSRELVAIFDQQPVELDTTISFDPQARVEIQTALSLNDWLAEQPWGEPLADGFEGRSNWSIVLAPDPSNQSLALTIASDLDGVAINWPAPFNKASDVAWPLEITRLTNAPTHPWTVSLNERWRAAIRPLGQRWSVAIEAGQGEEDGQDEPATAIELPEGPGLRVSGGLERVDVGAWQARWQQVADSEVLSDEAMVGWMDRAFANQVSADVTIEEAIVPGLVPGPVDLRAAFAEDQWLFNVDGPSVSGEVVWPSGTAMDRSTVVDLAHARLLTSPPESDDAPIDAPNLQDPRQVRPLTVLIESLSWGELALGEVRLETHRTADGLELELIDVSGPDLRLQARGQWVQAEDGEPRSLMTGRLSSRNFNQLVQATGYQAGLRARQASVDFELDWPGTPLDFNLFRVAGGLDFELRGGNIPQASAGAGRLLGLISFNALPRRLMLDFRDVFASGFPFDGIEGRFDMQGGMAQTDGVKIASPAAVMTLTGTTDMIARTYDQSLVIEPGLGSTLPVIGGLAGGPVGAAAGLLLRTIFNQPLKGVSMARYTIQGPWSEPTIELVDAEVADVEDEPAGVDGMEEPLPPPPEGGDG